MSLALSPAADEALASVGGHHELPAIASTCRWGAIDPHSAPVLSVASGDSVDVQAITHHAGDAPDLLMDDVVTALWKGIAEEERGPGVHILTGPIEVVGARPGSALAVAIDGLAPRVPFGSNCAAHWGLLHDIYGKERITIYELEDGGLFARPRFGFDFTGRPRYDLPGFVSEPASVVREPFSASVRIPVRPHLGVLGVLPPGDEVRSSTPPGVFGGNVDDWRFGPGSVVFLPVFRPGAGLYVGDPHFAQGDGEVCGTAIEASSDASLRVAVVEDLPITAPVLETETHWFTHGFGDDLDEAMRMAVEQMLALLQARIGLSADDAYSLVSVAVDLGVTQVVDRVVGCHAGILRAIFD